eukprot:scaffold7727_cov258-Pinguiococcus_pyrenoidosus.AAC.10
MMPAPTRTVIVTITSVTNGSGRPPLPPSSKEVGAALIVGAWDAVGLRGRRGGLSGKRQSEISRVLPLPQRRHRSNPEFVALIALSRRLGDQRSREGASRILALETGNKSTGKVVLASSGR